MGEVGDYTLVSIAYAFSVLSRNIQVAGRNPPRFKLSSLA